MNCTPDEGFLLLDEIFNLDDQLAREDGTPAPDTTAPDTTGEEQ